MRLQADILSDHNWHSRVDWMVSDLDVGRSQSEWLLDLGLPF
jgi:hypothetical protein